jgi:hypothetical protein
VCPTRCLPYDGGEREAARVLCGRAGRYKAMVERALTVVEVVTVICASGVAAIDRADARSRAGIRIESGKFLRVVVEQAA